MNATAQARMEGTALHPLCEPAEDDFYSTRPDGVDLRNWTGPSAWVVDDLAGQVMVEVCQEEHRATTGEISFAPPFLGVYRRNDRIEMSESGWAELVAEVASLLVRMDGARDPRWTAPTTPADTNRANWLTEPCPSFCTGEHHEDDQHPDDRVHDMGVGTTPVSGHLVEMARGEMAPADLQVLIEQHVDAAAPTIRVLGVNPRDDSDVCLDLTRAEALRHALLVLAAVAAVRPTAGGSALVEAGR